MSEKREMNGIDHMAIPEDPDYQCGIGILRIKFLQRFATAAGFTGFFILPLLASQTLSSYINSQIPTLEKQFGLSSYESGILMTFNDFGFLFAGLLVSSIPKLVHIPRWLFTSVLIFAISGLLCSLPHFIIQSENEISLTELRTKNNSTFETKENYPLCLETEILNKTGIERVKKTQFLSINIGPSLKTLSIGLIGIGMVLQGAAKSIRTPFLTQYLDGEDKSKTGFYMGIIIGAAIFGPALSFAVGGLFSRIYVTLEEVDMSTKDPRWIGAWWLGFVVFGVFALVVVFPVICFPRYLTAKVKDQKDLEEKPFLKNKFEKATEISNSKMSKIETLKERASSYIRVIKSPVYVCIVVAFALNMSSIIGPIAFKSKYIEAQFGIPLWKANLLISGLMIATVSTGSLVGGYLTKKFKMSPRLLMGFSILLHSGQIIFYGSLMFVGCEQPIIQGPNSLQQSILNTTDICHCDTKNYFPICGTNGLNYHSPCYAGCKDVLRNGRVYSNCTLIPDGQATAGLCPFECNTLIPYLALNVLGAASGSLKIMPMFISTIRSVEDRDKSTAAGLKSISASVLAFIPAPIVYGKVIDTTCRIWNTNSKRKGSCLLYNIEDLRYRIFGTSAIYKLIALIFMLVALWKVWKIKEWKELRSEKVKDTNLIGGIKTDERSNNTHV